MPIARAVGSALSVFVPGACAQTGPYARWRLRGAPGPGDHDGDIVYPGDVLPIRLFNQPDMSARGEGARRGKDFYSLPERRTGRRLHSKPARSVAAAQEVLRASGSLGCRRRLALSRARSWE